MRLSIFGRIVLTSVVIIVVMAGVNLYITDRWHDETYEKPSPEQSDGRVAEVEIHALPEGLVKQHATMILDRQEKAQKRYDAMKAWLLIEQAVKTMDKRLAFYVLNIAT